MTMTYAEMKHPDEPLELRRAFGAFPTGVVALAAMHADEPIGIAASSFASVSLEPPLVSVCIAIGSQTWQRLSELPRLGISVFSDGQAAACRQLGTRGEDKFRGLSWHVSDGGAVFLHEASAWFDCTIENLVSGGDHVIVLLRVERMSLHDAPPLVFHASEFRRLDTN
jgi:flavin reductase (DIM6/NTAB) family NADH-FMN oxidoreductase RutF